jgi:hypothetical protein|eukprot:COSAG03_NODE_6756_length_1010_cov_1.217344_1_plen_80_part_00
MTQRMPKDVEERSMARFAIIPTGEQSPGPCSATRTPKNSQSVASLIMGVRPPISDMWTRMKSMSRSLMRGRYLNRSVRY